MVVMVVVVMVVLVTLSHHHAPLTRPAYHATATAEQPWPNFNIYLFHILLKSRQIRGANYDMIHVLTGSQIKLYSEKAYFNTACVPRACKLKDNYTVQN